MAMNDKMNTAKMIAAASTAASPPPGPGAGPGTMATVGKTNTAAPTATSPPPDLGQGPGTSVDGKMNTAASKATSPPGTPSTTLSAPSPPSTTIEQSCAPPSSDKRSGNRKRRRRNSNNVHHGPTTSLGQSRLSLKKRLYLRKSARHTPWYDTRELRETGASLLLALGLFPPGDGAGSARAAPRPASPGAAPLPVAAAPPPPGLTAAAHRVLRAALDRVALWRGRSERGGGLLSHAVDATADLAGLLLTDAEHAVARRHGAPCRAPVAVAAATPHQLRLAYAAVLLRSVNGLADAFRAHRTSGPLSVAHSCALAGHPPWIVDVRHDASHSDLPSLGVCRLAALESLRFWRRRYWEGGLAARVIGDSGGGAGGAQEGDGAGKGGSSPSPEGRGDASLSPEGGIRTAAIERLARYQEAAAREARCRNQETNGGQRTQASVPGKEEPPTAQTDVAAGAISKAGNGAVGCQEEDSIRIPSANNDKHGSKPREKQKSISQEPHVEDNDPGPDGQTRGTNPWAILNEESVRAKKKKKKNAAIREEEDAARAKRAAGKMAEAAPDATGVRAPPPPADPSARDLAAEFVRATPVDVAYSVALRYLVWGRETTAATSAVAEGDGPALLTPPDPTAAPLPLAGRESAFDELRAMYEPLLVAMTGAYPGFVVALFVHLADSVLCLATAAAARQHRRTDGSPAESSTVDGTDWEKLNCNVCYLARWIRHLLSREYHMHFDRSVAIYVPSRTSTADAGPKPTEQAQPQLHDASPTQQEPPPSPPPVDLKKKGKKKWTDMQLAHMRGHLATSSLRELGFPLNSVCDRLQLHQRDCVSSQRSRVDAAAVTPLVEDVVGQLREYLENILGSERVPFMGLYDQKDQEKCQDGESSTKETDSVDGKEQISKQDVPDTSAASKDAPTDEADPSVATTNLLSLGNIESMLENTDALPTNDDTSSCVSPDNKNKGHSTDDARGEDVTSMVVRPWTLCKKWDPCAIGTMPGYPA